ncbi:uncharacterized protein LOC121774348 [Salvia splendens]|uniref:uncharacterized protein LOC121774348 n=1 Tax=Salvia splendens TaxID=180675 RepID=UPI001C25DFBC|nr:uncharacterized protein LOC121774348 [Salvia splendens]
MVIPIKWNPPDPPWVKLNAKGNLRDATGNARGGGIICNHRGALLKAFTTPLRVGSVLEAELSAVLRGLLLAKEFGTTIWIELDATQVISLINTRNSRPAQTRHLMAQITLLQRSCVLKATFVHREGNMAAGSLVNMALALSPMLIFDGLSAPRHLKAIVRMEQMGIPNIRVENEE